jgi:hypothetical protein
MNSKEKECTPAEITNIKFGCRIIGGKCCVRCVCGPSAFFGEVGTFGKFRIKDNSMQCP